MMNHYHYWVLYLWITYTIWHNLYGMSSARKSIISTDLRPVIGPNNNFEFGIPEKKYTPNSIEHYRDYEFRVYSKNVRNNILAVLEEKFKGDPHFNEIYAHFKAFDSQCLDQYSDFIILIKLYGTRIHFVTSRVEYSGMEYTLQDWNSEPAEQFRKRPKFLGLF